MHEPTSNNKRIAYNTLLLYMRMLFLVLISLYTSRIVLKVLGVEDFGINNVVGGVITFLGFLTGSLAGASSRFITFALGKNDKENLKRVFGNIVTIHALFSLFVLAVGETVGLWFMMTQLNIPPERETAAFWVYQFSILTAMGSLVSAPYNAAIIAHEKMSAFAYLTIGDAVLKLSSVFILTVLPYDKLILYAFFILCIQFFDFILYIIYCTRHFEECRLRRMVFDREMFREIFSYAGWTMNGYLAVFGFTQGLNILLNIFFNPVVNAARGIAVQVQHIINNFSTNFQMALNPQLTKSYAQEDYGRMHTLLVASSKFSVFLMVFICLPLSLEAGQVLKWWLGEYPDHTVSFLRLVLATSILFCLSNPILTSVHATGKLKKFQIIEGTMLLSIVPVSYILLKLFSIPPESVFIVHICIEIVTQYVRLKIVLPMIRFDIGVYSRKVARPILLVVVTAPLLPLLVYANMPEGILSFFTVCMVSVVSVLLCTYKWGCDSKEKQLILNKIRNILQKKQS